MLGAGIAGLACATALAQRGHSVHVLEQAPALTEIGAGLQIAPNGLRVLQAMGIAPPGLDNAAVHLIDGVTGRSLLRMPLGPGFRLVHRADLIAALAAAAERAGVVLRLGMPVTGLGDGVVLCGGEALPVIRLIGADGVRGVTRAHLSSDGPNDPGATGDPGHADRSGWTGQVAWRATVPLSADWPQEARVYVGPGRHLVMYPLRQGQLLNIVAVEERAEWVAASWSHRDDPANLRAAFAGFADPLQEILALVEQVHLWGLSDHGLSPRWHLGRTTLIGDAAHPTLPFLAQGANLALEDAWTLARDLDSPALWEARRRPRVARALAEARANAVNYHLRGPRRALAHLALRLAARVAPAAPLRRYDWLYGHDVTAEAALPPRA